MCLMHLRAMRRKKEQNNLICSSSVNFFLSKGVEIIYCIGMNGIALVNSQLGNRKNIGKRQP